MCKRLCKFSLRGLSYRGYRRVSRRGLGPMQVSLRNRIEKRYLPQVDLAPNHPRVRQYISDLAARGRYDFSPREVQSALGVSADAVKLALNRLAKQKLVASPVRGFWLIIPPEYRSLGC